MEIFIELKRFLRYIGLLDFKSPNSHKISFFLQVIVILVLSVGLLPTLAFVQFNKDAILGERIQCLATFISYSYCLLTFAIILCRKDEFIGLITVLERTMNDRERHYARTVYKEMNAEVEQLSRRVKLFVCGVVTPLLMTPPMVISFFNYYVLDMGDESFRLFSPMR